MLNGNRKITFKNLVLKTKCKKSFLFLFYVMRNYNSLDDNQNNVIKI